MVINANYIFTVFGCRRSDGGAARTVLNQLLFSQRTNNGEFSVTFQPRDAMLARLLAMALCLSVCLLVCLSVCVLSKQLNESSRFLVWELPFTYPITFKGNSDISKNNGTSLWNSVPNSRLRKFRHGISIVETCYRLSSTKVDAQSMKNWTVVGQLS